MIPVSGFQPISQPPGSLLDLPTPGLQVCIGFL